MNETDTYREWAPPEPWRHVVACCWEHRVGAPRVHRVVPDGCADLLVFGPDEAQVVGVADEVALPVMPGGTRIRGVRIRPEAVAACFTVDAASLRNLTVDLADVVGARRGRELLHARALDAWIRSVQPDARVAAAVRVIADDSVDAAAAGLGYSSRQLRRVFETAVGLGPKSYQRVVRFQRFLQRAELGAPLVHAAAGAGYADQAHMSREVRRLSGLTPTQLIAERTAAA